MLFFVAKSFTMTMALNVNVRSMTNIRSCLSIIYATCMHAFTYYFFFLTLLVCQMQVHRDCLRNVFRGTCYKNSVWYEDDAPPAPPSPQIEEDKESKDLEKCDKTTNGESKASSEFHIPLASLEILGCASHMATRAEPEPKPGNTSVLWKMWNEIITTEHTYVKILSHIVDVIVLHSFGFFFIGLYIYYYYYY